MKKRNKIITVACVLLVAVVLSVCVISGTFAKYATKAEKGDSARVAKFGVKLSAENGLFSDTYKTTSGNTLTVVSSPAKNNLVAPGTENATGLTFKIEGTPEVSVKVTIAVDTKDVFVKYGDNKEHTYYPVVYTLTNGTGTVLKTGKLSEIEAYLEGLTDTYDPNTNLAEMKSDMNLDGTYKLTWVWGFETDHDVEDTALGNIMAGITEGYEEGDYCTDAEFTMTIKVEQVD